MLFTPDRAARLTAVREAAHHGLDADGTLLFINSNPTSICDPESCPRSTVAAIAATAFLPERIAGAGQLRRIVTFYRDAGFKAALDDLGSGYGSLKLLGTLRPDFVKLDMELIRGGDGDPFKAAIAARLLEMARDLGISAVAEGIETMEEWGWVHEQGADDAQGYLFARPGSPPPRPRAGGGTRTCSAIGVQPAAGPR